MTGPEATPEDAARAAQPGNRWRINADGIRLGLYDPRGGLIETDPTRYGTTARVHAEARSRNRLLREAEAKAKPEHAALDADAAHELTLGDIADKLREFKAWGATLDSIEYVLDRVWPDEQGVCRRELDRLAAINQALRRDIERLDAQLAAERTENGRLLRLAQAAEAVARAWNVPGVMPAVHERMQHNLRGTWPTLARAVEALAKLGAR